eukprot:m.317900 g.317900  ORF g.317900 m.317900 type:complete len:289 (+) comp19693_c1_seq4:1092-1958(+)
MAVFTRPNTQPRHLSTNGKKCQALTFTALASTARRLLLRTHRSTACCSCCCTALPTVETFFSMWALLQTGHCHRSCKTDCLAWARLKVNGAAVFNTTRWTTNEAFCPDAAGGFAAPMPGYNVIGQVDGLTPGTTVYPHAVYMGKAASLADCEKHVAANASLYALEWHSANLTDGFATMCYASADTAWDPQRQDGHTAVRKAGVDVLFTMSKRGPKVVNAILMQWPADGTVVLEDIKVNNPKAITVEFLGYGPVPFSATPSNAMSINLTDIPIAKLPCEHKWVLAIRGL